MSTDHLRIIPADPQWLPEPEPAEAAAAAVRAAMPEGTLVHARWHGHPVFVDPGAQLEAVICPHCAAELDPVWWQERMDMAGETLFSQLAVVTPCCRRHTSLNDLDYHLPAGFARFVIEVERNERSAALGLLSERTAAAVVDALGHPVRQVLAHY